MTTEAAIPEREYPKRLLLVTLIVAGLSTGISNRIVTLLASDIATTFFGSATPSAVAITSQLGTVNNVAEIVMALALTVLAIRFRHKLLYVLGATLIVVSAIGNALAPSLLSMLLLYALEGTGSIMIAIMAFTLIGEILPANKKAKAVGYISSLGAVVALIINPLVGPITNVGGWRLDFLVLAFPISIVALILASVGIPSRPIEPSALGKGNPYVGSFRQIFTNRSATALLVVNILTNAGTQVAVFALAFYRTVFQAPRDFTIWILQVSIVLFIVAPAVAGHLVSRFGAKRVLVLSTILATFFTMTFFFVPNLWVAATLDMLHVWFTATAVVAAVVLIIDQVPKSRGTMVSLNSVFNNFGTIIATTLGGAVLFVTGLYGAIGLTLGGMTIAGIVILIFWVKDTTRERSATNS